MKITSIMPLKGLIELVNAAGLIFYLKVAEPRIYLVGQFINYEELK